MKPKHISFSKDPPVVIESDTVIEQPQARKLHVKGILKVRKQQEIEEFQAKRPERPSIRGSLAQARSSFELKQEAVPLSES